MASSHSGSARSNPADPVGVRDVWRRFARERKRAPAPTDEAFTIGLAATFTAEALLPYLGGHLLLAGSEAPDIAICPYNQVVQLCLDPSALLERERIDAIVILCRIEDLAAERLARALAGEETALAEIQEEIDQLLRALESLRGHFAGALIVSTLPYPSTAPFDRDELDQATTGAVLHGNLARRWADGLAAIERLTLLDLDGLLQLEGQVHAHDARGWYLYRQPYTGSFLSRIGQQLARIIRAQSGAAKKCIVVDCDNTLWGGTVGEDGLSGIGLGEDFPGRAFRDFQGHLLRLRDRGIFLAVASKNNAEDVFEVFDEHDAMLLTREHVAVFEVHWDSKVDSLRRIAAALNIGTEALVFIDDSPREIAEVKERLPEVTCLLVPEETAELPDLLRGCALFDLAEVTEDDRRRAERMRAEQVRQESRAGLTEEEFLRSLELKVAVSEAEPRHMARVTQLINKTNQFNLTTIRRTQSEVEALAAVPGNLILVMEVKDRFASYGLVGVAALSDQGNGRWWIDTLLMSCRVLGRKAETALISRVSEAVRRRGGATLVGEYRPTRKNVLVKDLFREHHFQQDSATGQWLLSISETRQPPDCVEVSLHLGEP